MKILFLGTSHGVSEKNRFRTSMLLETKEGDYFVDMGAPIGTLLRNNDRSFSTVRAAFITHMHSDHAISIPEYTEACNAYDNIRTLWLPEESDKAAVEAWIYAMHGEELFSKGMCRLEAVKEGSFYNDGNLKMTAVPTKHLKRGKSFAYIAECEEKTVLFTGDLSDGFADFPKIAAEQYFDAVVCELTHFDVETAVPKFNAAKTKKLIFNHVRDDKVKLLNQNSEKIKLDYYITNDGDVIDI